MNEEEYARNLAEYKSTVEKIVSIKNSIEEIFNLVDNDVSRKYKEVSKSLGVTQDNIMMYLGMLEDMINDMIKQYAFFLAQNLKMSKNLEPNNPILVTLNNMKTFETESVTSDALGAFEFHNLVPGSWQVVAMDGGRLRERQPRRRGRRARGPAR